MFFYPGDCYMAATGMPYANENHAKALSRFGLRFIQQLKAHGVKNPETGQKVEMRLGIHSASAMAGIVGRHCCIVVGDQIQMCNIVASSLVVNVQ